MMAFLTGVNCSFVLIVVLTCSSLIIPDIEHLFMYLTGHLYVFFGEMSIKNFCPFFDWVVCFFVVELYGLFVYFRDKALDVTEPCSF